MNTEVQRLRDDGYILLRGAVSLATVVRARARIDLVVAEASTAPPRNECRVHRQNGIVYAARNLDAAWPDAPELLPASVRCVISQAIGPWLVRSVKLFDKPPGSSWALPWHRDVVMRMSTGKLSRIDDDDLRKMLIARVHLDEAHRDNGAVEVARSSHLHAGTQPRPDQADIVDANPGDILLMTPLLLHRSARGTGQGPRRVIHFDVARSDLDTHSA